MDRYQELVGLEERNQIAYEELLVSIEATSDRFNLLIAICDDSNLRNQIIARYERELSSEIQRCRTQLNPQEPSLRAALHQVTGHQQLSPGDRAVITVLGAEQLHFVPRAEPRSQQQIFFGYLQWTREALAHYSYAIVLWVTYQLSIEMTFRAPDFWSWRSGVVRFESHKTAAIGQENLRGLSLAFEVDQTLKDSALFPLEDLQYLIRNLEQKQRPTPALGTLYDRAGRIYKHRLDTGEFQDYQGEQQLAIDYFQKAILIQEIFKQTAALAATLQHLAELYELQNNFERANSCYQRSLQLTEEVYGAKSLEVADSLDRLGGLLHTQGQFETAVQYYDQARQIRSDRQDQAGIATSLNHLGNLYHAQRIFDRAEQLYQEALTLRLKIFGEQSSEVATLLNNLALLYCEQGRYSEAEPLLEQALAIKRILFGAEHPDVTTSQNNLALLYVHQGRYPEAEASLRQVLKMRQHLFSPQHIEIAGSLNNLAFVVKAQGHYVEAKDLYAQACDIYCQRLGDNHPLSLRCRENLQQLPV